MNNSNKKFVFKVSLPAIIDVDNSTPSPLLAIGPPLQVIRYRLALDVHVNDSCSGDVDDKISDSRNVSDQLMSKVRTATSEAAHIWYKDEGGRDHGIGVTISLMDSDGGPPVKQVSMPFILSLCYSDTGEAVCGKSSILSVLPECFPWSIDRNTGQTSRKVRINDISKNHQRRCFVIKVAPDLNKNPLLLDVAGTESEAVEVRSKRTKRQREILTTAPLPMDQNRNRSNDDKARLKLVKPCVDMKPMSGDGIQDILLTDHESTHLATQKLSTGIVFKPYFHPDST
jgi:hypothetical protein